MVDGIDGSSLLSRVKAAGLANARRLRGLLWPIVQTAAAAGLAWYLTRDVLGHKQPFFAPIAAAVCLSASNVLRGERAVQMIVGVALGIGVGLGVQALLGTGPVAIGVAALVALCVAVLIGHGFIAQGLMFFNQAAASAILVLAFGNERLGLERLIDALVGGGLAIAFSVLLFPANPFGVLRDARRSVVEALRDVLTRTAAIAERPVPSDPGRPLWAADRLSQPLADLTQARATARQLVRSSPRWWPARDAVRTADQQATHLALFASSVVYLARTVTETGDAGGRVPPSLPGAISDLAAAAPLLAEERPDTLSAAATYAAKARERAEATSAADPGTEEEFLATIVEHCTKDLHQVINLSDGQPVRR